MPKPNPSQGIGLTPYTDIFSVDSGGDITYVPLEELHPPKVHPFKVKHDKAMERLAKNIKENGMLHPGLVRPLPEGGYELISGNRRRMACELAGLPSMPVIIRELDDDSAAIAMVDCNLEQREEILISEKAAAFRVKMDAMCHKGIKDDKQSVDILMEQTGESRSQIFRILRLVELVDELTEKLNSKKLTFNPAVELSYLSVQEDRVERLQSVEMLEKRIKSMKQETDNASTWAKLMKRYTELETLDSETLLLLIDKIIIGEPQKIGNKRICDIQIVYNYVGDIDRLGLDVSTQATTTNAGVTAYERQAV